MRINRTSTRRGSYEGRGRGYDGGYEGRNRGVPARGRAQGGAREGYQRENGYARSAARDSYQNGYAREQRAEAYERPKARKARTLKSPMRLVGLCALAAAVVVGAVLLAGALKGGGQKTYYSNAVTSGVKINGQDVSGQDVDKLRLQLKSDLQKEIGDIAVTLIHEGQTLAILSGVDLGATENVDEVIGRVALLARVGTPEQRKADEQKYREEGYEAAVDIKPDPDVLKARLAEIAKQVDKPHREATVNFNWLMEIPDEDIETPTQEEIDRMFTLVPEVIGAVMDVDATAQMILDAVGANPKCSVEIVVNPFVPKYTTESLKKSFHLLSLFNTHISGASTADRVTNIKLALSKVNGATLWPGQEFSFNAATGPRTAANGYKLAHVINGGTYVDDWGGGVCQASSTLYGAALYGGMTITDSGPHSIPSDYVKLLGFDAMVNYPNGDLKFKNESAGPVFIYAKVTAKNNVYVLFLGQPLPDGQTITLENDKVFQGPTPEPETKVDAKGEYAEFVYYQDDKPYVVSRSHPEIRVDSYRIWKDKDGSVINRELLRHDHYPQVVGLTVIGKNVRPAAPPPSGT
jgi:vancomycin resistance protein YoaR